MFLLLPAGASPPEGVSVSEEAPRCSDLAHAAVVQLLQARRIRDAEGEVFEAGRLAVRWYESEVGPETHHLLSEQTRLAWKGLRAATRPATVMTAYGQEISGMRIGPAAYDLVANTRMPLTRGGIQRLWLVT
ncbi:hypothetical protein [Streptomyces sp. NPDC002644]